MSDNSFLLIIAVPFVLFMSVLAWASGGWTFALEIFLAGSVSVAVLYWNPLGEGQNDENGPSHQ